LAGGDLFAVFVGAADLQAQFFEGRHSFFVLLVSFERIGVFAQRFEPVLVVIGDAVPADAGGVLAHLLVALGDEEGQFAFFHAAIFLLIIALQQFGCHSVLPAFEGQAAVFQFLGEEEKGREQEQKERYQTHHRVFFLPILTPVGGLCCSEIKAPSR